MTTTVVVAVDIDLPSGFAASSIALRFDLSGVDTEGDTVIAPISLNYDFADGSGNVELWRNSEGVDDTHYAVTLIYVGPMGKVIEKPIGGIALGDAASYSLAERLRNTVVAGGGGSAEQALYDALLAARDAAVAANVDAQAAKTSAEAAAIEAQLYDGPKVDTFADLSSVTPSMLAVGGFIRCIEVGSVYQRVSTGGHLDYSGAGGVRLNVLINSPSMGFSPVQFGAKGDGTTDDTAAVRAAVAAAKSAGVGLFHRIDQKFRITDPAGVWFGSDNCATWVRGAEIALIAAFNGGVLFDLTGIGNGGRDSFRLYGTVASGFTPSYGVVQARPKQASGFKSSGNTREIYCNLVGGFLAAAYCSVESESNSHRGSVFYNSLGIAAAWLGADYFKDTFRLPITGASADFTPGGVLTGATSGATATILRVNTGRTMLFCRRLTGTFTNGETVTGSISGSTATASIPTGYIVTGVASPNATLGVEEASTSSFQTITDCWFNNTLGDDLFPTVYARTFNDLTFRAPNISADTTGDLMEFADSCAGISIVEPYWHSNHRYSVVFGDAGQASPNQIFDSFTVAQSKFAGNPTARIKVARSNVQINNCNVELAGAIDLGEATMNGNNRIRLRNNAGNPASFTAGGPTAGVIRGILEIDAGATINITSPQNSNKLTIVQPDTGLVGYPRRPTSAVTIASDAITLTYGPIVVVDTEGAAATDTLSTITAPTWGAHGMTIYVRALSASRVVTVSITGGNIRGAANYVLDSTSKMARLVYDANSALWYLV